MEIPGIIDKTKEAVGRTTPKLPDIPPTEDETKDNEKNSSAPEDDFEALTRRFAALKKR